MSEKEIINILIVSDKPETLLTIEDRPENFDLNIVKVASGEKAINLMQEHDFAFACINVTGQEKKDFETIKIFGKSQKSSAVPIILLIPAGTEKEFTLNDYEPGMIDYLYTPVDPSVLKSKVNVFIKLYIQKKLLNSQTVWLKQKEEELQGLRTKLTELKSRLEKLTPRDSLTRLPNRHRFMEFLELEWRRCIRTGGTVSLIMIEIDSFKQLIDHHGRQAGDDCLKKAAGVLSYSAKRVPDFVVQYSEYTFAVVLPETDKDAAFFVAERMREEIEIQDIPHWHSPIASHVTTSLGIASTVPTPDSSPVDLIDTANGFLDEAKKGGGNQVRPFI